MSIILKENGGLHQEVELPSELTRTLITLGLEESMSRPLVLDILKVGGMHAIARGKTERYKRLQIAIEEINCWKSENINIEY